MQVILSVLDLKQPVLIVHSFHMQNFTSLIQKVCLLKIISISMIIFYFSIKFANLGITNVPGYKIVIR